MTVEPNILLVDDDPDVRFSSAQSLRLAGITVQEFPSADAVMPLVTPLMTSAIVTDVCMKGMSGLDLLDRVNKVDPNIPVILVSGHGDISMAVGAMQSGAYDFIEKPISSDRLVSAAMRAVEKRRLSLDVFALRQELDGLHGIDKVLRGKSPEIKRLRDAILRLGRAAPDVLIQGETGAGKEMVAQCLHQFSALRDGPFVALNCGAIPDNLFESELFGHEAGAFSGATKRRIGKLEYASGGTVFLDEIESLPYHSQVKLLRALQDRRIERLGSNDPIAVNFRVVAATKSDLSVADSERPFRSDLYYRLNIVKLDIPPLRERREDIPLLFEHFVLDAAGRYQCDAPLVPYELLHQLMAHNWPGNVRELRNIADRFVLGVLPPDPIAPVSTSNRNWGLAEIREKIGHTIQKSQLYEKLTLEIAGPIRGQFPIRTVPVSPRHQ